MMPVALDSVAQRRAKALGVLTKGLREIRGLSRRATFRWRHLRAGVLIFQESQEQGGGQRTFAISRKLGEGGYSTIWRVHEWQPDGAERQFAVKRVLFDSRDAEQAEQVRHEVRVMRSLPPHPNVVELIGTCHRKRGTAGGAQDELFLLLELCRGGSLGEMLVARQAANEPLSVVEAARAFFDMVASLVHLHAQAQPLAHRDVKPENFILSEIDGRWRLCDFGSATTETFTHVHGMAPSAVSIEEDRIHRYCTPQYRAPEMNDLRRGETVGVGVDVWALGVSLYKLLFMRDLFGTPGEERLGILNFDPAKKLAADTLPKHRHPAGAAFDTLLAILRACLTPIASRRPPALALMQMLTTSASAFHEPGGMTDWEAYARGGYVAGQLTISHLQVRGLTPKSSAGGIKAYLLFTCGGTRRLTAVAPRGKEATWPYTSIVLPTHAMCPVEVTLWAAHRRSTHDFIGGLTMHLPALLPHPAEPLSLPPRWAPLQQRSMISARVAGEFGCKLSWTPYSGAPASRPPPSSVSRASEGAITHGEGEGTGCSEAGAGLPSASAAAAAPTAAAAAGGGGMAMAAGSFWASEAAVAAACVTPHPLAPPTPVPPQHSARGSASGSGSTFDVGFGSFWESGHAAEATVSAANGCASGVGGGSALPSYVPSGQCFESMATLQAPWDPAPLEPAPTAPASSNQAPGHAGGSSSGGVPAVAAAGSFWATFDASPQLALPEPAPPSVASAAPALPTPGATTGTQSTPPMAPPPSELDRQLSAFDQLFASTSPPGASAAPAEPHPHPQMNGAAAQTSLLGTPSTELRGAQPQPPPVAQPLVVPGTAPPPQPGSFWTDFA